MCSRRSVPTSSRPTLPGLPCHSSTASSGPTMRTDGDWPSSTSDASDTPNASEMRQSVPMRRVGAVLLDLHEHALAHPGPAGQLVERPAPARCAGPARCGRWWRWWRTRRRSRGRFGRRTVRSVILLNPWCNRPVCLSVVPARSVYRPAAPSSHEPDPSTRHDRHPRPQRRRRLRHRRLLRRRRVPTHLPHGGHVLRPRRRARPARRRPAAAARPPHPDRSTSSTAGWPAPSAAAASSSSTGPCRAAP